VLRLANAVGSRVVDRDANVPDTGFASKTVQAFLSEPLTGHEHCTGGQEERKGGQTLQGIRVDWYPAGRAEMLRKG
jgi:hypothetical protein